LAQSDTNLKLARLAFESEQWSLAAGYYEAIASDRQNRAEALIHQTQCATNLDDVEKAFALAEHSVLQIPDSVIAWQQLSQCARAADEIEREKDAWQALIDLKPENEIFPLGLARILHAEARHFEAAPYFKRAFEMAPDSFEVRWARCFSALWKIYNSETEIIQQREFYARELTEIAALVEKADVDQRKSWQPCLTSTTPYFLSCHMANDTELQEIYGRIASTINRAATPPELLVLPPRQPNAAKKRIGFISGGFKSHTITKLFRGWWKNLDKSIFEIVILDADPGTDPLAKESQKFADDYRVLPADWIAQVETVRDAACDVLIYLEIGQNHVVNALASLRLAPVQAAAWGHVLTSGYESIDYFISGDFIEPEDAESKYTETLVRLPNVSIYYEPALEPPQPANRQQFGLGEEKILFLCAQTHYKYLPRYDDVLVRIASELPDSQFVFLDRHMPVITDSLKTRLAEKFNAAGLNPDTQIVFLPQLSFGEYLKLNTVCDLFLDTLLWTGAMTTLEAIDCSLPVITMAGGDIRGLQSAGMLRMMKLEKYIAKDVENYIQLAVELGAKPDERQEYKDLIIEQKYLLYSDTASIKGLQDFLLSV
tara:strand:+ start:1527 stop:3326 length:1800 start_codon:yes stop_codon:yes gene_type:complete